MTDNAQTKLENFKKISWGNVIVICAIILSFGGFGVHHIDYRFDRIDRQFERVHRKFDSILQENRKQFERIDKQFDPIDAAFERNEGNIKKEN